MRVAVDKCVILVSTLRMDFVSEKELKEQAASGSSDEPVDHRTLYERLKEVRDKAEAEKKEMFSLKNQFRGLDQEETDFLDKVNRGKNEVEKKRKQEELDLLKQCAKAEVIAASFDQSAVTSLKPKVDKNFKDTKGNKQKDVMKKMVIKRKAESADPEETEKKKEKVGQKVEEKKAPEQQVTAAATSSLGVKKPALSLGYGISSDEDE